MCHATDMKVVTMHTYLVVLSKYDCTHVKIISDSDLILVSCFAL